MAKSQTVTDAAPGDEAIIERARLVATALDDAVEIPGTGFRIGLDPILGIAPVSGDLVAALCSLYVVVAGVRVGVPPKKVAGMLGRLGVELVVGSVPVLGTVVDAFWKVNKRNVAVIEDHVQGR